MPNDANYILIKHNEKILKKQITEIIEIDEELNEITPKSMDSEKSIESGKSMESGKSTSAETIVTTSQLLTEYDGNVAGSTDDDIESKCLFEISIITKIVINVIYYWIISRHYK